MAEYTAPWFYNSASIGLLGTAEATLRKYWIIPLEIPWNMFTLSSGCADIARFMSDEKFAVICPATWTWFSVYDTSKDCGLFIGDSLHNALETWAVDIEDRAVFGFIRTNQGVSGSLLIPCKGLTEEDAKTFVRNVENQHNS